MPVVRAMEKAESTAQALRPQRKAAEVFWGWDFWAVRFWAFRDPVPKAARIAWGGWSWYVREDDLG